MARIPNCIIRTAILLCAALALGVVLCSCRGDSQSQPDNGGGERMSIDLKSTAFQSGDELPAKYTCDGDGISPPLAWSGVPHETQSLVLIADDPDAPSGTFVHWIMYNVPTDISELPEDVPHVQTLKNGAVQGMTSANDVGYVPPCPPRGTHRYIFHIYALDTRLELDLGATRQQVDQAMTGHVLAEGELQSKYTRQRPGR